MPKVPLVDSSNEGRADPDVRLNFPIPASVHAALRMMAFRERTTLRALLANKLAEVAELERIRGIV